MEVWKDIVGWEEKYQVSNKGRVKSLDRWINRKNGIKAFLKGKILNPSIGKNGYYLLALSKNCNPVSIYLHRLIAEAFIPNPKNKRTVNHINGITIDNNIDNLEWATYSENHLHAFNKLKRKPSPLGKFGYDSHRGKIVEQYTKDDVFIKEYGSVADAERYTGVKQRMIARVCRNERPYTGGYKWKYK